MKEVEFSFTVIIPTYNRIEYLKQSISSVREQTFKNWILHIVDNSSTDGTQQYLNNLIKVDDRIIYDRVNNNGIIAYSRNFALKKAMTNAVSFLDDDDIWYSNKLMDDYLILKEREGLIYSRAHSFSDQIEFIRTLPTRKLNHKNDIYQLLHYGNLFTTSTISFSLNEKTRNCLFNESVELRTWEDYELWVRLLNNCSLKAFFTGRISTKYRVSKLQNSSYAQDINNANECSKFFADFYKNLRINTIKNLPLWAHYSNMNAFYSSRKYKDAFISLFYASLISLRTFDIPFLFKSLAKFLSLFFNMKIKNEKLI